jgi:hypothetical protein
MTNRHQKPRWQMALALFVCGLVVLMVLMSLVVPRGTTAGDNDPYLVTLTKTPVYVTPPATPLTLTTSRLSSSTTYRRRQSGHRQRWILQRRRRYPLRPPRPI